MKFVFSPDVILCGWLGSKPHLTNQLTLSLSFSLVVRRAGGGGERGEELSWLDSKWIESEAQLGYSKAEQRLAFQAAVPVCARRSRDSSVQFQQPILHTPVSLWLFTPCTRVEPVSTQFVRCSDWSIFFFFWGGGFLWIGSVLSLRHAVCNRIVARMKEPIKVFASNNVMIERCSRSRKQTEEPAIHHIPEAQTVCLCLHWEGFFTQRVLSARWPSLLEIVSERARRVRHDDVWDWNSSHCSAVRTNLNRHKIVLWLKALHVVGFYEGTRTVLLSSRQTDKHSKPFKALTGNKKQTE